jgi:hypothetical protein
MSEPQPPGSVLRNILAVFAGMVAGFVLSLGTDELLHRARVFPRWRASMVGYDSALLLATIYRTVYGVAGGYLTAALARNRPMLHARSVSR